MPNDTTDKTVTWISSDTNIAIVDNTGKVKGLKAGTATITAKTNNDKTAVCTVTVIQKATGITLNKNELSLEVNQTDTLIATLLPEDTTNKAVTWISSDTNIATVDNTGKVKGIKAGTATITVKSESNNSVTATCTVTVIQKATEIKLNKTELKIEVNKSETLVATVLPADTTDKTVTWSSNKPEVATVENGVVTRNRRRNGNNYC